MTDLEMVRVALSGKTTTELKRIAKRVKGLPWQTLYKVATGRSANPSFRTVELAKSAIARAS